MTLFPSRGPRFRRLARRLVAATDSLHAPTETGCVHPIARIEHLTAADGTSGLPHDGYRLMVLRQPTEAGYV
jgi:hypothetical protein